MKLLKLVGILSLVIILCTGCFKNDEKTPEKLFDELPVYNLDKKDISDQVADVSKSVALLLPSNSMEVGKINEVDLNYDSKNEIVFFQKKEGLGLKEEVGFTILDPNNDGYDISYTEVGNKITYANFYDLDNDRNKEIILLIEGDYLTTLTICRYENGKINTLVNKANYNYFNRNNFTKMGILVDDINNDNVLDLIVYNYNYKTKKMNLYACNLKEDKISILDKLTFKNIKSFDNIKISIGNIETNKKALFLNLVENENNKYITEIAYLENKKFVNAFEEYDEKVLNSYYIPVYDVNNDEITNIPIVDSTTVTIDTLSASELPTSAIVSWNKYNGKKGEEADLLFVNQIYYNYENNFKFLIPNNLVGKIYINEATENINNSFKTFEFYYYDSNIFYEDKNQEKKSLFTLNLFEKNIIEDTQNVKNKESAKVFETNDYVFSVSDVDEKELKKFDLTIDIIKDYFSKIS